MKRLSWSSLPIFLGMLALLVTGCAKGETSTPTLSERPSRVKVSLALDWYPNANHAGLYMAGERGYFEDENLEVDIFTPGDPATVLQTVASGRDDFGISYQTEVLLARQEDVPVVSVMAIVQHPLNVLMTLKSSGIDRPGKLKGKSVGYPGIAYDVPLLETMLEADGLILADVELVNVGFNLVQALVGKRVDAVIGAYVSHETILAENQGYPVNVIRMEDWGVPDFYELVLVTSEKKLKEDPDVVRRFLRAVVRGYDAAMEDPQAAIDLLLSVYAEADEAVERPGVGVLVPLWRSDQGAFGWQEEARWTDFANWMKANGLLREDIDPLKAFSNEYMPDIL